MYNIAANVISSISHQVAIRKDPAKDILSCPFGCLLDAMKMGVGIIATPFSIITCGKVKILNRWSDLIPNGANILPRIFSVSVRIINPVSYEKIIISEGFYTQKASDKIHSTSLNLSNDQNWATRNVALRALQAIAIPVLIVTRTADGLLAVPLVAVSLLTFGSNPEINGFASNQLKSFGSIFSDVSIHLRAAFNPSAINIYGKSVNV